MAAITIPESVQAYFPAEIDPSKLWVSYSAAADSLTVYFTNQPVPSVWDDLDDFAFLGFSLHDESVVTGLKIEHFSKWLVAPGQAKTQLRQA